MLCIIRTCISLDYNDVHSSLHLLKTSSLLFDPSQVLLVSDGDSIDAARLFHADGLQQVPRLPCERLYPRFHLPQRPPRLWDISGTSQFGTIKNCRSFIKKRCVYLQSIYVCKIKKGGAPAGRAVFSLQANPLVICLSIKEAKLIMYISSLLCPSWHTFVTMSEQGRS